MDADSNSHRKKTVGVRLNQSYSNSSLLEVNRLERDFSVQRSFKLFDSGKVVQIRKKEQMRILPPIQCKASEGKLKADGKISRRNNSDNKIKSKGTKSLGKLGSLSFSTSASCLNKGAQVHKILNESEDDSALNQMQVSKTNGWFTPTFRNMICDSEEPSKVTKVNSFIHKKVESSCIFHEQNKTKPVPANGLIKMNSHFINGLSNLNKALKEPLPICKSVKKIKVLEHKFPKDMFF